MGENQTAVSINKPYFSKLKDIADHHPELRRVSGAVNYARAIEYCIDLQHTLIECKMHPVVIFVCDDCKKKADKDNH